MQTRLILFILVCLASATLPIYGQSLLGDFGPSTTQAPNNVKALRQRTATLKTDLLRLPQSPELTLELFEGISYDVKIEQPNHRHPFNNIDVYWGTTGDPAWNHRANYHDVIMTVNRATEKAVIYAMTSDGTFMVMPTTEKGHYSIYEEAPIDWSSAPCAEAITAVGATTITSDTDGETGVPKTILNSGCNEQDENGIYVIDVFFSYSHEAELTIGDVLAHAISQAETVNQGFANSETTNARMRVITLPPAT
jgi:hypothetical protein